MDTITSSPPTARILDAVQWLGSLPLPSPMGVHVGTNYGYDLDSDGALTVSVFPQNADQLREVRRLVGKADKRKGTTGLVLDSEPYPGVTVTIYPPAGTCERVQVGTEKVVKREPVGDVEYREVEVEEPVFEWQCPESVLEDESEAVPA